MWNHLSRSLLAATAFLTSSFGATPLAAHSPTSTTGSGVVEPPRLEFIDMPSDFIAGATWATGLFAEADLDLPPLRFVFHGDVAEPCQGRPGLHHQVDHVSVIEICTTEMSNATAGLMLHETSHAWIDLNLTDAAKDSFKKLRGWTYWRNYAAARWHENGTEQAAEIMVWGLIDRPLKMIRIDQNSCDELDAGYRTLTGRAPLHGYRDQC
jgi:hypothetical protein